MKFTAVRKIFEKSPSPTHNVFLQAHNVFLQAHYVFLQAHYIFIYKHSNNRSMDRSTVLWGDKS
jgi:hypothetical protein